MEKCSVLFSSSERCHASCLTVLSLLASVDISPVSFREFLLAIFFVTTIKPMIKLCIYCCDQYLWISLTGYLMCIFNEKLGEEMLETLQDYEFAVWHCMIYKAVYGITRCLSIYINNGFSNVQFADEEGEHRRFFYHTAKTKEMDNLLGDIYHKILGMYSFFLVLSFHNYTSQRLGTSYSQKENQNGIWFIPTRFNSNEETSNSAACNHHVW